MIESLADEETTENLAQVGVIRLSVKPSEVADYMVRYLGSLQPSEPSRDLLFVKAANGIVQQYLNAQCSSIDDRLRLPSDSAIIIWLLVPHLKFLPSQAAHTPAALPHTPPFP